MSVLLLLLFDAYFVIDSVRKLLDTPSCMFFITFRKVQPLIFPSIFAASVVGSSN